jgi:hypothetical protein
MMPALSTTAHLVTSKSITRHYPYRFFFRKKEYPMNVRIPQTPPSPLPAALAPARTNSRPDADTGIDSGKQAVTADPTSAAASASASITPERWQERDTNGTGNLTDLTYTDPRLAKTGQADLQGLLEESERKAQAIINLIRPLIEQQGLSFAKIVSGEQKLSVDPKTIEAAKAAIAPDGELGVQKTAERILSFAKAAIGNDPAKLDTIRAAVEKGFQEAADMLGGTLPEISQQTLSAIQTEFERWKADGIPAGDTVKFTQAEQ